MTQYTLKKTKQKEITNPEFLFFYYLQSSNFFKLSSQSQQLKNQQSYILPKENQLLKGVITNLDEKILNTQMIGFGVWFKWQPLTLEYISITETNCREEFILSLVNFELKQHILILYQSDNYIEHQLKLLSDYFIFQEEIWLDYYFEGVWIFFDSFFDFTEKFSTFYLFNSLTQELTEYKINQIPIISDQIQFQIGKVCDQCTITNFKGCFTRFEGRLSILFEQVNFDETSYLNYIKSTYNQVNDCEEKKEKIIIGTQIFDGDFYLQMNLGILEKPYYQLSGWVKIINDDKYVENFQIYYLNLIQIVGNFKEVISFLDSVLQIQYSLSKDKDYNEVIVWGPFDILKNFEPYVYRAQKSIEYAILTEWHYIQLDVGYPEQAGTLKFYSYQLDDMVTFNFQSTLFTGVNFGLFLGGDTYSKFYLKGTLANFEFKTFCLSLVQEFILDCHYTCQTCFSPSYSNCLSCKSNSKRQLKNNQCLCEPDTFQFQEYEICQSINDIFTNFIIMEEELLCKMEEQERFDDVIICSFGYFKYQGKYCIQCPHYNTINFNSDILCVNCLYDPDQFSITLQCFIDAVQLSLSEFGTYDQVLRSEENIECFKINKLDTQFQLQLIQYRISNNPPICRKGYYYEDEKCYQCGFGCFECQSSLKCSQCEEGYYLEKNNICTKCLNCLKCELQYEQLNCLSCPEKYYQKLKNEQCLKCGQYCADCRSNGYCNYCIDSSKYFISIDGINCLVCNIPNCKSCYQLYNIDGQILYTSFNLNLENYNNEYETMDHQIYCGKCQDDYIFDLTTNTCIKRQNEIITCQYGLYNNEKSSFQCKSWIFALEDCSSLNNCQNCLLEKCLECKVRFYVDFLTKGCLKCPSQCETCIQQNKILKDNWKIEIQPIYDQYINIEEKTDILSNIKADYEIQCTTCPPNYTLFNSNCIEGCNDECLKCEVIKGKAKCVECKPYNNKIIRSIDTKGQCLRCSQNCELCIERSKQNIEQMNKFFIVNEQNSIQTSSCYKPSVSINNRINFLNQFKVIDCEKFEKCKRYSILTWNLYCDIKQFQELENKSGYFQEGNYYFNDFFENEILSQAEIKDFFMYLNEQAIELIEINLNIFQGNVFFCQPLKNTSQIHTKLIQNTFFLKSVNLKITGQQRNVLLKEFIFDIQGFQQIQFENFNFDQNQITITDTLTNSISFQNCLFGNNSPIQTLMPYNLNLKNVTIQFTEFLEDSFFQFHFRNDGTSYNEISILIDGLKIINSKFQTTQFITIITDIGPKVICKMNNLEILQSEFQNSHIMISYTTAGLKNMIFGNLIVTQLKIENVILKNSILFYTPNILLLNINTLTTSSFKLLSNSYFILSNQLNCLDCYLNEIEIDKSYLFSNNVPLLYQTSSADQIYFDFNQIKIKNIIYNQEQSLIQIIKFQNCEMIIKLKDFKINLVNPKYIKQSFISLEISLIYIYCTFCYRLN